MKGSFFILLCVVPAELFAWHRQQNLERDDNIGGKIQDFNKFARCIKLRLIKRRLGLSANEIIVHEIFETA
jgi:hypothetical protein